MADRTSKKELRRQRRQQEKSSRARSRQRETLFVWGGLALIVVVVGFLVFNALNPSNQPGTAVLDQGNFHLSSADESHTPYNTVPPTSGPHMPSLAAWGISAEAIPDTFQVHNLEDGGVLMQYDCPDGCPELVQELTALANEIMGDPNLSHPTTRTTHFILAPHAGIRDASGGNPIALTAWARIQYFDSVDREGILNFVRAYINIDHHVRGVG